MDRFDRYDIDGIPVYRFRHSFAPMGTQKIIAEIEYDNQLAASHFKTLLATFQPDIIHFFHLSRLGSALIDAANAMTVPAFYTPTDFWAVCPTSQLLLTTGEMCDGPSSHAGNCIKHLAMVTRWRHRAGPITSLPALFFDACAFVAKNTNIDFPLRRQIAAVSRRKSTNVARLNALHKIVSPTRLMTDVLIHHGVRADLIKQAAYGIDITGFDDIQRDHPKNRPLTIGFIGTLASHKGCHVLVQAFNKHPIPGACLKIYGDTTSFPAYMTDLRAAVGGNSAIEFRGTFPNAQIAEVLAEIDVLVVPSVWYENAPLVVYSALAAKCPVIASDFPGLSEVVKDGWNGLLFEPGNVAALADCLARLHREPALLPSLSANCRPPKSIKTYVDELLDLYRHAMPAHGEATEETAMSEAGEPHS
jgi:glycosyltransferase involved in cell wall biosynthesis